MSRPVLPANLQHTRVTLSDGVGLHVVLAGPEGGPPVLLLHGFPEFWYGWRNQIGPLAAAGYRVIVPDLRGYNLSDKPRGLRAYHPERLTQDVVELIEEFGAGEPGARKLALVAHDWGGVLGWSVAQSAPERVTRYAVLNMPHPQVMLRALRTRRQLRRSWYMFFFLIPRVPEWWLARERSEWLFSWIKRGSKPGALSAADQARYLECYRRPGAWRAMLSWYRAALLLRPKIEGALPIAVPTLLIWGRRDAALGHEMAQPSIDLCARGELVFVDDAGHFVAHDAAGEVNARLLAFFAAGREAEPHAT
jgi:pimeloyl-ACP methyl ester carboxylesterase